MTCLDYTLLQDAPDAVDDYRCNLYVKNFGFYWTEKDLRDIFSAYGELKNWTIMRNEDGSSRRFGFVSFARREDARNAAFLLNGVQFDDGTVLYVSVAQKKLDRQLELNKQYSTEEGCKVVLRNLKRSLDESVLRSVFLQFGKIIKLEVPEKTRGIGFLTYARPKSAERAVKAMNGKRLDGQTVFVALYDSASGGKQRRRSQERLDNELF